MAKRILVVDDEESIRWVIGKYLEKKGYEVDYAETGGEGLEKGRDPGLVLILLDIRLPDTTGLEVFETLKAEGVQTPVLIITAQSTMSNAVEAMRLGAYDYISKPFDLDEVLLTAERAIDNFANARKLAELRSELTVLERQDIKHQIIGTSPVMLDIYKMIGRIAEKDYSVLITGESGTGKELVAGAIHYNSHRKAGALVSVNIAAMPRELLESELFGYEKGAFTGARERRMGRFEEAHGGTLLLDEIADMPMDLQTKLLRVLEEKRFYKLGGDKPTEADVRLLAATNKDLEREVEEGRFRKDLYYRLNSISISLPPLTERGEDIPMLVEHFIDKYSAELNEPVRTFPEDTMALLARYAWPGNVRELENTIKRVLVLSSDTLITPGVLLQAAPYIANKPAGPGAGTFEDRLRPHIESLVSELVEGSDPVYESVIHEVEKPLIEAVMRIAAGNKKKAASILGINRNTLSKKIAELGIESGPGEE